jgi:hypothetical protein
MIGFEGYQEAIARANSIDGHTDSQLLNQIAFGILGIALFGA